MDPLPTDRCPDIDALRGLTPALMIGVNVSIGERNSYRPLVRVAWHGITLTVRGLPSLLCIVGTALR